MTDERLRELAEEIAQVSVFDQHSAHYTSIKRAALLADAIAAALSRVREETAREAAAAIEDGYPDVADHLRRHFQLTDEPELQPGQSRDDDGRPSTITDEPKPYPVLTDTLCDAALRWIFGMVDNGNVSITTAALRLGLTPSQLTELAVALRDPASSGEKAPLCACIEVYGRRVETCPNHAECAQSSEEGS